MDCSGFEPTQQKLHDRTRHFDTFMWKYDLLCHAHYTLCIHMVVSIIQTEPGSVSE